MPPSRFRRKKTLAESLCENKIAENRLFGKDERFIGSSRNVMSRQKLLPLTCLLWMTLEMLS